MWGEGRGSLDWFWRVCIRRLEGGEGWLWLSVSPSLSASKHLFTSATCASRARCVTTLAIIAVVASSKCAGEIGELSSSRTLRSNLSREKSLSPLARQAQTTTKETLVSQKKVLWRKEEYVPIAADEEEAEEEAGMCVCVSAATTL